MKEITPKDQNNITMNKSIMIMITIIDLGIKALKPS
jgi:hypothetical protein